MIVAPIIFPIILLVIALLFVTIGMFKFNLSLKQIAIGIFLLYLLPVILFLNLDIGCFDACGPKLDCYTSYLDTNKLFTGKEIHCKCVTPQYDAWKDEIENGGAFVKEAHAPAWGIDLT